MSQEQKPIELSHDVSRAINKAWDEVEKAKDQVVFSRHEFNTACLNLLRDKNLSPRHHMVVKGDGIRWVVSRIPEQYGEGPDEA